MVYFHIPKTAGTSLRAAFVENLGADRVAFRLSDGSMIRMSDMRFDIEALDKARRLARSLGMLKPFSSVIRSIDGSSSASTFSLAQLREHSIHLATGHFTAEDIDSGSEAFPRTTLVRDPLLRMWSHYRHWQEAKGTMHWHRGSVPYTRKATFQEFSLDPLMHNYQASCLGGLDFEVIGNSYDLGGFLDKLGFGSTDIPILNPGKHNGMPHLDAGFIREFEDCNQLDYNLYYRALDS